MTEKVGAAAPEAVTYGSNPVLWLFVGIFMLLLSLPFLSLGALAIKVALSLPGGPPLGLVVLAAFAFAMVCLLGGFGVLFCLGFARGLPRLAVTPAGISLRTPLGVQWAEWSSLSLFALSTVSGRAGERVPAAKARIIGDGVGPSLRGKPEFVIKGTFRVPVETVVEDLNRLRPATAGSAAPASPPPSDPRARGKHAAPAPAMLAVVAVLLMGIAAMVLTACFQFFAIAWRD